MKVAIFCDEWTLSLKDDEYFLMHFDFCPRPGDYVDISRQSVHEQYGHTLGEATLKLHGCFRVKSVMHSFLIAFERATACILVDRIDDEVIDQMFYNIDKPEHHPGHDLGGNGHELAYSPFPFKEISTRAFSGLKIWAEETKGKNIYLEKLTIGEVRVGLLDQTLKKTRNVGVKTLLEYESICGMLQACYSR